MKYILKATGECNPTDKLQNFIERLSSAEVDQGHWEDSCKCWFNTLPVEDGDILIIYTVLGEPRNNGKYQGRIWGYYTTDAQKFYPKEALEGQWKNYIIVENCCKSFSEQSKEKEILNVRNYNVNFNPGTIRRGYSILEENVALQIIKDIKRNK